MGGSIARGIMKAKLKDTRVTVSNPGAAKLEALRNEFPEIRTTGSNVEAVKKADLCIIAVKPKFFDSVLDELDKAGLPEYIVSIVPGTDTVALEKKYGKKHKFFYVMPNTAISVGKGMCFISSHLDEPAVLRKIETIFRSLGQTAVLPSGLMNAATALSGCGIAYVYKYIQACIQAGVQMGFTVEQARNYTLQTMNGALAMLETLNTAPQTEIDRVTTPGGMTIKGINSLEATGFTASVITSILAPLKK